MTNDEVVSLKQYFESVLAEREKRLDSIRTERDHRYAMRFDAMKDQMATEFKATQRAVDKAEAQLSEWKVTANEFRGQLKDQAATFISRSEVRQHFENVEKEMLGLRDMRNTYPSRAEAEQRFGTIEAEIQRMREQAALEAGRETQADRNKDNYQWLFGAAIGAGGIAFGIVTALLNR